MWSEPITWKVTDVVLYIEISSYVRGYHVYQEKWHPVQGDPLPLALEPTNTTDKVAVAVIKKRKHCGTCPLQLGTYWYIFSVLEKGF